MRTHSVLKFHGNANMPLTLICFPSAPISFATSNRNVNALNVKFIVAPLQSPLQCSQFAFTIFRWIIDQFGFLKLNRRIVKHKTVSNVGNYCLRQRCNYLVHYYLVGGRVLHYIH